MYLCSINTCLSSKNQSPMKGTMFRCEIMSLKACVFNIQCSLFKYLNTVYCTIALYLTMSVMCNSIITRNVLFRKLTEKMTYESHLCKLSNCFRFTKCHHVSFINMFLPNVVSNIWPAFLLAEEVKTIKAKHAFSVNKILASQILGLHVHNWARQLSVCRWTPFSVIVSKPFVGL